jgi:hypothetical protein
MMFVMLATVLVLGLTEGFCWFVGDVWFDVSNTLIFEKGLGFWSLRQRLLSETFPLMVILGHEICLHRSWVRGW